MAVNVLQPYPTTGQTNADCRFHSSVLGFQRERKLYKRIGAVRLLKVRCKLSILYRTLHRNPSPPQLEFTSEHLDSSEHEPAHFAALHLRLTIKTLSASLGRERRGSLSTYNGSLIDMYIVHQMYCKWVVTKFVFYEFRDKLRLTKSVWYFVKILLWRMFYD